MYAPRDFVIDDVRLLHDIVAQYPLALLATNGDSGPILTHLPIIMRTDEHDDNRLYGHFARANPHWKQAETGECAAVFRGVDGYITPSWYPTKQETGKVVPTWNYVSVEARGKLSLAKTDDETREIVAILTNAMEKRRSEPWGMSDAPQQYTAAMLRGLVAFSVEVTALSGIAKLSQNKAEADYDGVLRGTLEENPALHGQMLQMRIDN